MLFRVSEFESGNIPPSTLSAYSLIAVPRERFQNQLGALLSDLTADGQPLEALSLQEYGPSKFVYLVEPLTWAAVAVWIGEKLLEAVIAAVVSEIVSALFGGRVDLERLLRNVVEEFARQVRLELRKEALRRTEDRLRSLQRQMEAYAADPIALRSTLEPMAQTAQDLYSDVESLGLQGAGALAVAATLRVAVYMELAIVHQSDGLWRYTTNLATTLSSVIPMLTQELTQSVHSRFGNVVRKRGWSGGREHEGYPETWSYKIDNGRPDEFFRKNEAIKHRQQTMQSYLNQAITNIIVPVDGVAQKLAELSNRQRPW